MSYSEQRSLELAMTLASDPQGDPAGRADGRHVERGDPLHAGADPRGRRSGRALLIVEHDMDVVFALGDRISVLVYGEVIATGTPDEIRSHQGVREAYLGEEVAA